MAFKPNDKKHFSKAHKGIIKAWLALLTSKKQEELNSILQGVHRDRHFCEHQSVSMKIILKGLE